MPDERMHDPGTSPSELEGPGPVGAEPAEPAEPAGPAGAELHVPDPDALPEWAWPGRWRSLGQAATVPLSRPALVAFAAAALKGAGARPVDARLTAQTLVLADARGHPSHGVSRLRQNVRLIESGSVDPAAHHEVLARRSALESWHAHRGLGPAVGHRAMARAVARARRTGLAGVVVRDAGHFGIAGAYVLRAMQAGLIGIASCDADARVPPSGARAPGLGTNPIAIGAPDGHGRGFLLDMATSVVALGKVEILKRAGLPVPAGWGLDRRGRPTTDPDEILPGMLLPLGGATETGGYKGYGLGAAVDLLTGVLSGGSFGPSVTGLWDTGRPTSIGQLHLALDPALFGGGEAFGARLRAWREELTALPRQAGIDEILLPGEPEWRADDRQATHIDLLAATSLDLAELAVERGLRRWWRAMISAP